MNWFNKCITKKLYRILFEKRVSTECFQIIFTKFRLRERINCIFSCRRFRLWCKIYKTPRVKYLSAWNEWVRSHCWWQLSGMKLFSLFCSVISCLNFFIAQKSPIRQITSKRTLQTLLFHMSEKRSLFYRIRELMLFAWHSRPNAFIFVHFRTEYGLLAKYRLNEF